MKRLLTLIWPLHTNTHIVDKYNYTHWLVCAHAYRCMEKHWHSRWGVKWRGISLRGLLHYNLSEACHTFICPSIMFFSLFLCMHLLTPSSVKSTVWLYFRQQLKAIKLLPEIKLFFLLINLKLNGTKNKFLECFWKLTESNFLNLVHKCKKCLHGVTYWTRDYKIPALDNTQLYAHIQYLSATGLKCAA